MSFKTNKTQQITLNDSFINQTPRTQKMIMNSWCKDFADIVFPAIKEDRFSVLYSDSKNSRPNTPINIIVGALILKESNGLNDDELLESICCDVRYQYALHTTHLAEQPVSDRTFSRFRARLYDYERESGENLLNDEMMHLSEVFGKYMNLNSNIKRMDSLMIASRCKRMSRLEIIYSTVANAVQLIHRLGGDEILTSNLIHYLNEDDYNHVIYYCKGEDVTPRLEKVLQEAVAVKQLMEDDSFRSFSEYKLLIRVLTEQSDTDESGNCIPKKKKEITPSSLQNPSDPDATYRSKAGKDNKGYVGNIVETVGKNGDSLITDTGYDKNSHSDSQFCKDYLSKKDSSSAPETMITDGAYGGEENRELANSCNTKLVTTALIGKDTNPIFADFIFSEDGKSVTQCPMGNIPEKTTYYPKTGVCRTLIKKECCDNCPHKDECKGKPQKKNYAVHVSQTMKSRASYLKEMTSKEFITLARMRNAVEGIPSVLRRKYHIDDIPAYGLLKSRQFFLLKIGAYNFKKLLRHNRIGRVESALNLEIA